MFSKNSFHRKYLLQFSLISISGRDISTRSNFPWDCPPVAAEAIPLKWKTQKIILWQFLSSQASHQINVRLCQDFDCNKTLSSPLLPNGPFIFGSQEKTFCRNAILFLAGYVSTYDLISSPTKKISVSILKKTENRSGKDTNGGSRGQDKAGCERQEEQGLLSPLTLCLPTCGRNEIQLKWKHWPLVGHSFPCK